MRIACAWQAFVTFLFLDWGYGVQYIPERVLITNQNDKYTYNISMYISRYGRKSPYYFNLQAGLRHSWGNNVTIHMLFYEYQHNQYRRSFVEFHMKICDLLQKDPYFGKLFNIILVKYNIGCPIPAAIYDFRNVTLPSEGIPNILPFEKGKVEVDIRQLPTQELINTVSVWFHVKKN